MSFTQHRGIEQRVPIRIADIIAHEQDGYEPKDGYEPNTIIVLRQAIDIQKKHKNRLLCGGLALKLYGVIDRTIFSDIDFIAMEKSVKDEEYISLKCATPHAHCLFLASYVKEGAKINGLVLQDLDQIIYHKMKLGRDKDIEDLKVYHERDFF